MKNFSTVGARFVISALFAGGLATGAHAATCDFLPNAPDQYRVVKGDTLWDISGKFLQHPWCWSQVWNLNRAQIANPHWIYPGQTVYFNRRTGRLGLSPDDASGGADGTTRLSPQVRSDDMDRDAVPSIRSSVIEPFLTQPLVIEADRLAKAPRIVASEETHVFLGPKDRAYVRGALDGATAFQVFRPGKALVDPDTKQVLGYEAFFLGIVKLRAAAKPGSDVHTFEVVSAKEEMGVGDQLVPLPPTPIINYAPHPPQQPTTARLMSIYGGVTYAGQNQIVTINRGALDGLDIGAVLQLYHFGASVPDTTAKTGWFGSTPTIKLPDEQYGELFVFRVFQHISYGLIMQASLPVEVGDVAKSPE